MSRLSAWSRRKLKDPSAVAGTPTGASADTDIVPDTRGVPTAPAVSTGAEPPPSEVGDDLVPERVDHDGAPATNPSPDAADDLPPPEALAPGSDMRTYLASNVDRALKKRALRQLFRGERYNLRDGLDDYDDDFRAKLTPLPSETAQRLRRWWDNIDEESTDDSLDDSGSEPPDIAPVEPDADDRADHEDVADSSAVVRPRDVQHGLKDDIDGPDPTST